MSAIKRALLNPERLLEAILLQAVLHGMTVSDLLRCQQVCRTWKRTIEHSVKLQKALFLEPTTKPEDLRFFWDRLQTDEYDRSINMHMLQADNSPDDDVYFWQAKRNGPDISPVYLNNLVARLTQFPLRSKDHQKSEEPNILRKATSRRVNSKSGQQPGTFQRWSQSNASFRTMLLSQPAATSATIQIHVWSCRDRAHGNVEISKHTYNPHGVTAGDVWDTALSIYETIDADRGMLCWVSPERWAEPGAFGQGARIIIEAAWKQYFELLEEQETCGEGKAHGSVEDLKSIEDDIYLKIANSIFNLHARICSFGKQKRYPQPHYRDEDPFKDLTKSLQKVQDLTLPKQSQVQLQTRHYVPTKDFEHPQVSTGV